MRAALVAAVLAASVTQGLAAERDAASAVRHSAPAAPTTQVRSAPPPEVTTYQITKDHWSAEDEKGFSSWVQALGEANCHSVYGCLMSPANPWRFTDGPDLDIDPDCADLPYILRAYYAAKNGLPFSYSGRMSALDGDDPRYGEAGNLVDERFDVIDAGAPIELAPVIRHMVGVVSTASMRVHPRDAVPYQQDFYSPKIAPGAIRPGTVIYDTNGHAVVVYKIEADGRILFMESFPDRSFGRGVYGTQFARTAPELGSGFKNFRSQRLVGYTRRTDGTLAGGFVVNARNAEIPDSSLEQYVGVDHANKDWRSARFEHSGIALDFSAYVRAALASGGMKVDPLADMAARLDAICDDVKTRAGFVARAIADGIDRGEAPGSGEHDFTHAPGWGVNSSWGRDARLRAAFAELATTVRAYGKLYAAADPHLQYAGRDLRRDLDKLYRDRSRACAIAYRGSDGRAVTLTLDDVRARLFALSFDPYHCVERRWGASGRELRACRESGVERRWYEAQQSLRNQTQAREMSLIASLPALEGKTAAAQAPADVGAAIAAIERPSGRRQAAAQDRPN